MLKVSGTCKISKDPTNGNFKLEFATTQNGANLVKGSLYWYNSAKKDEKTSSNIRFVAYKDMVNFFRDNCNEVIEIKEANLKSYSGETKDGRKYYGHEIIVFDAAVYQKKEIAKPFNEPRETARESDSLNWGDDDIPF